MQKFKWKGPDKQFEPTHFREKILAGVGSVWIKGSSWSKPTFGGPDWAPNKIYHEEIAKYKPKLHTIREDKHNRWKPGMSIQMVYRGPKYSIIDHFNKGIPELEKCVSVQKIEIKWIPLSGKHIAMSVKIDGKQYTDLDRLAANDGFNSFEDFAKWFKKPFTGKIIHWTDLKY